MSDMNEFVSRPTSRFLKVKCNDCSNEQVIFSKSNTIVTCAVCGTTLAKPKGGNAEVVGEVLEVLDDG